MQLQARRRAQASITNSPSSSLTYTQRDVRLAIVTAWRAHAAARAPGTHPGPGRATYSCPRERLPRAEPQSGGSPDPIPNSAVKPRLAESTAAPGRGRTGRSARRGRFFIYNRDTRKVSLFVVLLSYHTVLSLWSFYALTGRVLKSKADCNLYVLRRVCLYVIP